MITTFGTPQCATALPPGGLGGREHPPHLAVEPWIPPPLGACRFSHVVTPLRVPSRTIIIEIDNTCNSWLHLPSGPLPSLRPRGFFQMRSIRHRAFWPWPCPASLFSPHAAATTTTAADADGTAAVTTPATSGAAADTAAPSTEGASTPTTAADTTESTEGEPREMVSVPVAFTPSFPALPQYVALAEGFYADHGLDVEAVQVTAGRDGGGDDRRRHHLRRRDPEQPDHPDRGRVRCRGRRPAGQ